MSADPVMRAAMAATADLLERLVEQQKAGPAEGSGYTKRYIEVALWDGCDAGGETVDAFEFEEGEIEALIGLIRRGVAKPRAHIPLDVRPLLVRGMLATDARGPRILINSEEEPPHEQVVTLFHEVLHLLGLTDEFLAEEYAMRLAAAAPDILRRLAHAINVPETEANEGYPGIAHDFETMRGLLRGVDSLLRRCLVHGLLRAEAEVILIDIERVLKSAAPSHEKAPAAVGPLVRGEAGDWIDAVALDIAELGDRTSPDHRPDMMLVTAEELRRIILNNLPTVPTAT